MPPPPAITNPSLFESYALEETVGESLYFDEKSLGLNIDQSVVGVNISHLV